AIVSIPLVLLGSTPLPLLILLGFGIAGYAITLALARRGQITAGGLLLIGMLLLGVLASLIGSDRPLNIVSFLVLPILAASLVLRPAQIWLVFVLALVGLVGTITVTPTTPLLDPANRVAALGAIFLLGIVTLLGFLGGRTTAGALAEARVARVAAETLAAELTQANAGLEQRVTERTSDLNQAVAALEARTTEQERLIAENERQRTTIREMSMPTIPVSAMTMVMPLIGVLDSARLRELEAQALHAIERTSIRYLVLDITGTTVVDSQVAQGILNVVQAARLLGTEVILVGIRPEVAQAILGLGLNLPVRTFSDLQAALNQLDRYREELRGSRRGAR
ncbi:MAG: STAS domain-containing protein, partial [Roseiflexaceae bacterium]